MIDIQLFNIALSDLEESAALLTAKAPGWLWEQTLKVYGAIQAAYARLPCEQQGQVKERLEAVGERLNGELDDRLKSLLAPDGS